MTQKPHVAIYMNHYDYIESDWIPCSECGATAVDIHHKQFKSQGGTDEIGNLTAMCRICHNKKHGKE